MKLAGCGVELGEFLKEDGIGEEYLDIAWIGYRLDIHDRQPIGALGEVASQKARLLLGNIVDDILDQPRDR